MRDPNRIDPLLDLIRVYWKANPDLRLGQIVYNMCNRYALKYRVNPYYVEDNDLAQELQAAMKGGKK